jgi:ribose 5-phosphate isomerase A
VNEAAVRAAAVAALGLVADGACIGIGSGRAAAAFIAELGVRVRGGLRMTAVATSNASAALARDAGIPLIELGDGITLDAVFDGADEVAPNLDLVKGWGGALVRERIVTASSRRQVILVDESKRVATLGQRGRVPVEIIPLARWLVERDLQRMGVVPTLRAASSGHAFVSDNGNHILDCALSSPLSNAAAARALERALLDIVGVVDTGLFLGTATDVFIGQADGSVQTLRRAP